MKAKLDENLPLQIATRLRELGHDVHTAQQESLSGCDDSVLWKEAQREGRTLITQDLDFSDSRRFALEPITESCRSGCAHPVV